MRLPGAPLTLPPLAPYVRQGHFLLFDQTLALLLPPPPLLLLGALLLVLLLLLLLLGALLPAQAQLPPPLRRRHPSPARRSCHRASGQAPSPASGLPRCRPLHL